MTINKEVLKGLIKISDDVLKAADSADDIFEKQVLLNQSIIMTELARIETYLFRKLG